MNSFPTGGSQGPVSSLGEGQLPFRPLRSVPSFFKNLSAIFHPNLVNNIGNGLYSSAGSRRTLNQGKWSRQVPSTIKNKKICQNPISQILAYFGLNLMSQTYTILTFKMVRYQLYVSFLLRNSRRYRLSRFFRLRLFMYNPWVQSIRAAVMHYNG